MFAWSRYLENLLKIQQIPDLHDRVAGIEKKAAIFYNRPYPFTPAPLWVERRALQKHVADTEAYCDLLEKIIVLFRDLPAVQEYFNLPPEALKLALLSPGLRREVQICRLDGYVCPDRKSVRVLENNADAPAGILFTARLAQLVRQVQANNSKSFPLERRAALFDFFMRVWFEWCGVHTPPSLAILIPSGEKSAESFEICSVLQNFGLKAIVAYPGDLAVERRQVMCRGTQIDMLWNKINTVVFERLAADQPRFACDLAEAIEQRLVCHLNPFSSRYIAESKRALAMLHDPTMQHLFSASERKLVCQLVPLTISMTGGLHDTMLLEMQHEFVIKAPYDIRGEGVTIGRGVGRRQWQECVRQGSEKGFVAQKFQKSIAVPILADTQRRHISPMTISLDSFMFGGRLVGLGAKASNDYKVNIFQGGRKVAVQV